MIKINLLKSYSQVESDFTSEADDLRQVRVEFLKRAFIFLIGPLGLFVYEQYNLPALQAQLDQQNAELAALAEFNQRKEAIASEISKYEEDKKRLNRQTAFLERISRERLYPVELVNHIKKSIPAGVWISGIVTSGRQIEITGGGDTEKAISDFENQLSASQVLTNVKLQNVDLLPDEFKSDIRMRSFTIVLNYAAPTEGGQL